MRKTLIALLLFALGMVSLMAQQTRQLNLRGDRFAPLTWDTLSPEQKTMVNDLLAGSRTSLDGPFNAYLRSPDMGNIAQKLGEYVRFRSSVPRKLNEMAIILTARHWSSQYEWYAHKPMAIAAGLSESVVDDIAAGRRPAAMKADEAVVYDFCAEMREHRRVSDATFAAARSLLGEQGVMDLVAAMGYYDIVSMTLNLDRYPLPNAAQPPFPEPK
jgi:4-carboxymuconolactone decarboxylase